MRPEPGLVAGSIAALVAILAGALLAAPYARLTAPAYAGLAELAGHGGRWRVERVEVVTAPHGPGQVLQLTAIIWDGDPHAPRPRAVVNSAVSVGGALMAPLAYFALIVAWPARGGRRRLGRLVPGLLLWPLLEAATTGAQLLAPLWQARGILAGAADPARGWLLWSAVLEAGGRIALGVSLALLVVGLAPHRRQSVIQRG